MNWQKPKMRKIDERYHVNSTFDPIIDDIASQILRYIVYNYNSETKTILLDLNDTILYTGYKIYVDKPQHQKSFDETSHIKYDNISINELINDGSIPILIQFNKEDSKWDMNHFFLQEDETTCSVS